MSKRLPHKSARADGRGGWPTGKRRHADGGDWQRLRISLAAYLNDHWQLGVVSNPVIARFCGVTEKSVRRWLSGEDRPPPETQEVIRQWLAERRAANQGSKS